MNILALDLGTLTGWALSVPNRLGGPDLVDSGTKRLATAKEVTAWGKIRMTRRADPRILRLNNFINRLHESLVLDWILFEDVTFATSQFQTQMWASLRAAAWLAGSAGVKPPQFECCPVTTLKKFSTGKPGAKKQDMAAALVQIDSRYKLDGGKVIDQFNGQTVDDNAVDALLLLKWGKVILKNL
jgi:hypothetical protein